MTAPSADGIRTERRGAATWIRIDRPDRRNALNDAVLDGIGAAVRAAEADPEVRAIVLTGSGEKAFCAGADLSDGAEAFADADEPTTAFGRLARMLRGGGLPMIARVNGACVAGGMGLLSLCDLAVAADHARFGLPEAKVGVFPFQVLVHLRAVLPARHVAELCLTGELVDAARAAEIGLVNRVVASTGLDEAVDDTVRRIVACSPAALRRGKHALAAMERMTFTEAMAFAEAQIAVTASGEEAAEGLAAFRERRAPRWAQRAGSTVGG